MSDKRRFLKHTVIFGVGGMIGHLVPFLLLPLYTNYLIPAEYGILSLIIMTSGIITTVFLAGGIRMAAMTFYKQAESEEVRRRIAITISILLWAAVTAAIAASLYFVDYIDFVLQTGETKILTFGLAVALLDALVAVPMTLTQARLESLRFVLTNLAMAFSRLALCIYFVAGLEWGIWGFLYAQAIVTNVSIFYLTYRELRIGSIYPDVAKWKDILRFSLPLVPNGIFAFIYGASGWIAIIHIGPYEGGAALGAVGLYFMARKIVDAARFLGAAPLQQVWDAEKFDVYKRPDAAYVFGNFTHRLLCVHAFALLLISIFSTEIVRILSASAYHDVASFIPLIGLFACLVLFTEMMCNTFFIKRKTNYLLLATLFLIPFVLIFMCLFVPRWGVMGAIVAYILSRSIQAGFLYFLTQRFFRIHYPFGKMLGLLMITIACYVVSLFCSSGIALNIMSAEEFAELSRWEKIMDAWHRIQWLSIIAKLGTMALWGILIWFSGVLLKEDKTLVIRVFIRGLRKLRTHTVYRL